MGHRAPDYMYPPSFLSSSSDESFARLPLLSHDVLLTSVWRFQETIPKRCRTKAGCINLIRSDFIQQTSQLMHLSVPDLRRRMLISLPAGNSTPQHSQFSLACQSIHNRYGTSVATQLLSSSVRWNPPEVAEEGLSQPIWLQTPSTQLKSRLAKVETDIVKGCCDFYLAPSPAPKSKTERYDLLIQCFRVRLLYLLSLLDVVAHKDDLDLISVASGLEDSKTALTI